MAISTVFARKNKNLVVPPVEQARNQIAEVVTAFQSTIQTLSNASETLIQEARSNRDLALRLNTEAEQLDKEASQGLGIAIKIQTLTAG